MRSWNAVSTCAGYRRMRSTGISWFTAGMSGFAKMFPVEQYMEEEIKIVLGRFWMSTADSYMVTWQAIIYYSSLYFMWLLSLENVLFHWQKDIEWLLAKVAGVCPLPTSRTPRGRSLFLCFFSASGRAYISSPFYRSWQ